MPYEKISLRHLDHLRKRIQERVYTTLTPLKVEAWVTPEPVSFEDRKSGSHLFLSLGDKWGALWDCAWFHFKGKVPDQAVGQKVVLLIDVNGELCLVDEDGTPVQGLTNVNSEFDLSLGKPGKRVVDISSSATGGEVIDLWADAGCNDLFGKYRSGTLKEAFIAICNEEMRQLYYDVEVLLQLAEELDENSVRRAKILQNLYDMSLLLVEMDDKAIQQARNILAESLNKKNGDVELTISAIGHAHIDLAWLWPVRETIRKGARTFSTVLRNMEKYPSYIFGASQPQLYQWMKEYYPKLYEQIKDRISEGRWEVQGAMWVEPDANISGGEALIRQVLYGKRFFQQEFGKEVRILWVPDIFGYTASLPQILKKSGVDYVMTQKLSWNVYNDHPHHTFHWEGIDGSRVLTHLPPEDTYNSPGAPRSIRKIEQDYYDKNVSDNSLMLFGIGDGGGGPGEEHLERLHREQNLLGLLPVVQEKSIDFFEKLYRNRDKYKIWRGELYLEKHQGTLTTQARSKKYNREIEKSLRELEFAACLSSIYTEKSYPKEELEKIWKEVLLYQFHDILPGSSITRVYTESLERYEVLLRRVKELTQEHYSALAESRQIKGTVFFNSLPWERKEWFLLNKNWFHLSIPAFGYKTLNPEDLITIKNTSCLKANECLLENDLLRVEFSKDGSIASIYDKELKRECIAKNERANVLSIYHDDGDAWDFPTNYRDIKSLRPELVHKHYLIDGPKVGIVHEYHFNQSIIKQTITLLLESRQIHFNTKVDWKESKKMLRAAFPLNLHSDHVNCDIQFGHIKRPTHRNTLWDFAKDEICSHHWIDMSEPDFGVALLNDGKYGYRAEDHTLDINLLRSPTSPDPEADRSEHEFNYSLYPHVGDFVETEVYKKGYELNIPMYYFESKEEMSSTNRQEETFVHLKGKNVMIETIKKAEDDDGLIIRLFETAGSHARAEVSFKFGIDKVYEVDLMENVIGSLKSELKKFHLAVNPFEIKTLKIKV